MSLTRISSIKKSSFSPGRLKILLCSLSGSYFLSSTSLSFSNSAESQNVTITTLYPFCEWTVTNLPEWISVSASNGTGTNTISITTTQNTVQSTRTATITIAGTSVYISQAAAAAACIWPPSWGWC